MLARFSHWAAACVTKNEMKNGMKLAFYNFQKVAQSRPTPHVHPQEDYRNLN